MTKILPVIMSGGSGSRLWPLSRGHHPKQFLSLIGKTSMLQQTVLRTTDEQFENPLVICNEAHRFLVAEQLQQLGVAAQSIVLEPCGRNTAPAIAIAALMQEDPNTILLVLAADHVIQNESQFIQHVLEGAKIASDGQMLTFGIVPTGPETGYGYIKAGQPLAGDTCQVDQFVEKPELSVAEQYLDDGGYYWNSGMFMFTAARYLEELENHRPDILAQCRDALADASHDLDFTRLDRDSFVACPSDSIDYAVMEKTQKAAVMPVDIGWSDVGSWSSLWEVSEKDANGNCVIGEAIMESASNNFVHSQDKLVALVGVDNIVVVDTPDALLVADKSKVQDVKLIVNRLKEADRPETENHRLVYRPWGSYDSIDAEDGFQVKRITVKPGASLSLQMHHHRAEHWIVVSGTAEVTCGEKVFMLEKNQSTYIPLGEVHRLRNPGKIPLQIIEVQSGDYLGEDDIVRYEDNYGRS